MYRAIKSTSAHLGLLFVFCSLVIAPASLKVTGLASSLSSAAQTWRQVANVFGASYQPVDAVELSALKGEGVSAPANDLGPEEAVCERGLVASLTESPAYLSDGLPGAHSVEVSGAARLEPARCDKEKSKPVSMKRRVESVVLPVSALSIVSAELESVGFTTNAKRDLIGEQLEEQKIEWGKAMKMLRVVSNVNADFKFRTPAVAPKANPCKQRPAPTPEQREALRLRAAAASLSDMALGGPDNSEF